MKFTITAGYQWTQKDKKEKTTKENVNVVTTFHSELAIKKIVQGINNRFYKDNKAKHEGVGITYKRLRASAGKLMWDSIFKRIVTANAIIIDITHPNKNVYIELGAAMYHSKINEAFSIYLIKDITGNADLLSNVPSDLQGFFVSGYEVVRGKVVFKDNNSLLMSLVSDINDYFDIGSKTAVLTDEINYEEAQSSK
jgi:hypothetical protein